MYLIPAPLMGRVLVGRVLGDHLPSGCYYDCCEPTVDLTSVYRSETDWTSRTTVDTDICYPRWPYLFVFTSCAILFNFTNKLANVYLSY